MLETFKLQTLWYITERSQTNTAPALEDPREAGQTPLQRTICDAEGGKLENGAGHELWREVELEIDGLRNGIQHPGVYADGDRNHWTCHLAMRAPWLWATTKVPDEGSFTPQKAAMDWNATVRHVSVTGTGCFPRLCWSLRGHTVCTAAWCLGNALALSCLGHQLEMSDVCNCLRPCRGWWPMQQLRTMSESVVPYKTQGLIDVYTPCYHPSPWEPCGLG